MIFQISKKRLLEWEQQMQAMGDELASCQSCMAVLSERINTLQAIIETQMSGAARSINEHLEQRDVFQETMKTELIGELHQARTDIHDELTETTQVIRSVEERLQAGIENQSVQMSDELKQLQGELISKLECLDENDRLLLLHTVMDEMNL
jgi:hypothetical protein